MRARIGAFRLHATHDPKETTLPARTAFLAKFLDEQPAELPEAERLRRAEAARRAHMARLAYASARSRRKGAQKQEAASHTDQREAAPREYSRATGRSPIRG